MKKLIILFLVTSINIAFFTTYAQTDCDPATITKVEHEGAGNRITWTQPTGRGEVVITQGGNFNGWTGDSEDFGVYHRFTPEELATINGGTLTHIVFAPTYALHQMEPGHNYKIQIYNGGIWGMPGNRNPGALISSQELSNNNLLFKEENVIILEKPITIDASQELWIGYYCTNINSIQTPSKEPAGTDNGPRKVGFGDIIFYQYQWQTLDEINSASHYNWCIKGVVQTIDGATVTIYHNNVQIATDIPGTSYFHPNPTGDEHCYQVEVNCLEGGVSPLSNEFCLLATECNPATDLLVEYTTDCSSAELTWVAPENMQGTILYNIYRDETLIKPNHETTTFSTTDFNQNEIYIWSVKVVCPNGESDAVSVSKEVCNVGIKNNEQVAKFKIYPNPASNELRVTASTCSATNMSLSEVEVEIFDVYGRIQKAECRMQNAEREIVINISNLSSGIYFIRFMNEQSSSFQKFIKK